MDIRLYHVYYKNEILFFSGNFNWIQFFYYI